MDLHDRRGDTNSLRTIPYSLRTIPYRHSPSAAPYRHSPSAVLLPSDGSVRRLLKRTAKSPTIFITFVVSLIKRFRRIYNSFHRRRTTWPSNASSSDNLRNRYEQIRQTFSTLGQSRSRSSPPSTHPTIPKPTKPSRRLFILQDSPQDDRRQVPHPRLHGP